jgi:hypothetical protein
MKGQRWAEIFIASLVVGSGTLIYWAMAAGSNGRSRRYGSSESVYEISSRFQFIGFAIGLGIFGLLLALVLGLILAYFPGLIGRRHYYAVTIDSVFIADPGGTNITGGHPDEYEGEMRAYLTVEGKTEEFSCRRDAYLAMRMANQGTAAIDGGIVITFRPFA